MSPFFLVQFNLSLLFSFLIGVGVGLAVMAVGYLILVLASMRSEKYVVETKVKDVTDDEVYQIIKETQAMFKDENIKGIQSNIAYAKDLSVSLVNNIAQKFFPESKHPLYELSINEVLMLGSYISKRLDEILDFKGLRILRKLKISTIISFTEIRDKVEANSIVKATKKYKIIEAFSAAMKVINIINPIYWARKFIIDTTLSVVIKKLCLVMIGVVGEETYKIYSKSVFDKEVNLDTGVSDIINDIESQLEDNISKKDDIDFNGVIEGSINQMTEKLLPSSDKVSAPAEEKPEKKKTFLRGIFNKHRK